MPCGSKNSMLSTKQVAKDDEFWSGQLTAALFNYSKYYYAEAMCICILSILCYLALVPLAI